MAHRIEQRTPLALERAICLEPTVAPSAAVVDDPELARQLKGDLGNIILHAMQKQPERRYASVEQLVLDIQRHLDNLPVTARADSLDLATANLRVAELEKALEEAKRIAAQLEANEKWKA
jgi:hypothetical protein